MNRITLSEGIFRTLIIVAALVIIITGINQARSFLVSLFLAIFLSIVGLPAVFWLRRKHIPSTVAVLLVMAAMTAILLLLGVVIGASVNSFYHKFSDYQARLQNQISQLQVFLENKGIHGMDKPLLGNINPEEVMNLTARLFTSVGSALSNIVLILITVTFILLEASSFPVKLRSILGHSRQKFPQYTKFVSDIGRYMVIKTFISIVTGTMIWLWFWCLGVDFPALWGFLAFLLNYVPSVGSIVAAVPAVLLTLLQFGIGRAVIAIAGYMAIDSVLGKVIEPKLMGRNFGLSTLVVIFSLIFWGSLLGPIGMVLCVPFTMTLKFICENNESTRWIALLLGPEVPAENISSR